MEGRVLEVVAQIRMRCYIYINNIYLCKQNWNCRRRRDAEKENPFKRQTREILLNHSNVILCED